MTTLISNSNILIWTEDIQNSTYRLFCIDFWITVQLLRELPWGITTMMNKGILNTVEMVDGMYTHINVFMDVCIYVY